MGLFIYFWILFCIAPILVIFGISFVWCRAALIFLKIERLSTTKDAIGGGAVLAIFQIFSTLGWIGTMANTSGWQFLLWQFVLMVFFCFLSFLFLKRHFSISFSGYKGVLIFLWCLVGTGVYFLSLNCYLTIANQQELP